MSLNELFTIAQEYNLSIKYFVVIYLSSFFPIYFGAFLMLYGSMKKIALKKILKLDFNEFSFKNSISKFGFILFCFGWTMPYLYILLFGRNFHIIVYFIVIFIMIVSILYLIRNKFNKKNTSLRRSNYIIKKEFEIFDINIQKKLWNIYSKSFISTNQEAPCQQSIDSLKYFKTEMEEKTVYKYLLYINNSLVGFGMVTNNLNNCTWISNDYFKNKYPVYFKNNKLYYFMGISIDQKFQKKGFAKAILKYVLDDLPDDAGMGFDHSYEANKLIPYFVNILSTKKRKLKRKYLDKQVYYFLKINKKN
jgi:hypothetical protein